MLIRIVRLCARYLSHERRASMTKFLTAGLLGVFILGMGLSPAMADKGDKKKKDPDRVFQKLDANGDKSLSLEEMKGKGKREASKIEKRLKKLDTNSDGKLSLDEFKAVVKKKTKKNA
jgi:hypothetical protein